MNSQQHRCTGGSTDGVQSFVGYLHAVLPSRIRGEISRQTCNGDQASSASVFDNAIHNCIDQTGSEWLQGQVVQPTETQDLMSQRWCGDMGTSWPSPADTGSSGVDQGLAFSDLGLEDFPAWSQNELSAQASTWPTQFDNGNGELDSTYTGMPSYRSAGVMECSMPSSTSDGFTWHSDGVQWPSSDPHDIIVIDE